jgi:hypothetical protein
MRKLLTLVTLASMASCSRTPAASRPVHALEARESVYKVKVVITVDTSPLLPKVEEEKVENPTKDASEISFSVKANDLRPSIISKSGNTAKVGWSGTGWVAAKENGRTFIMTAGHVCETSEFLTVESFDWVALEIKEVKLPIIHTSHTLISRENIESGEVTILLDEDLNEKTMAGPDMCLAGLPGNLGTPLPISNVDPEYATHAEVIGAPVGLWGGNIAVTADLKFSGRGNVWGGTVAEGLAFTGDVAGGNSGSAIMKSGRVVAMLNLGGVRFKELTTGVPWETLRDFLRRGMHRAPKQD